VSILNQPNISEAYFFPQDVRCDCAIEVDIGDAVLRCYHYIGPHGDGRTLIHFHGNGEAVGHYTEDNFPEMLSAHMHGIDVLMVEYRGYGDSTGEVEMASMLSDGQRVMEQLGIDPSKTIAYGRSIGSLYALELAKRMPDLAGLVIDSGIADIAERFLARKEIAESISDWDEVNSEIESQFNHQAKIESYTGSVLLLHAAKDGLVKFTNADRLYEWAVNASIRKYTLYMEGDHNSIFPVNRYSILLHLQVMERELFSEDRKDKGKLLAVLLPNGAIDRGEMLNAEQG
jgi:pimeloyl-ACP methyl ester carboxylesterase